MTMVGMLCLILNQGEFSSEFGQYHVEITVPEDYKVAATGVLSSKNTENSLTTFIYDQDNIHDFAWFASPDFKLMTDKIVLKNGMKWR